jgi:ribosomal protein L10
MQNVINIDGKEYPTETFDETQKYVVTQIRNLQTKQLQAKMELDQVQVALQVYTNQLIASVKKEENSDE